MIQRKKETGKIKKIKNNKKRLKFHEQLVSTFPCMSNRDFFNRISCLGEGSP